ncbi:membrane dipeptidase [bacterium]|nr:membrane dipeptidase [bacterium]
MADWHSKISKLFTADLHCDALSSVKNGAVLAGRRTKGHFDLVRMAEGGIWAEILSIFVHPKWIPKIFWWRAVLKQIVRLEQFIEAGDGKVKLARSPADLIDNFNNDIRSVILEIEGLHSIEQNPDKLVELWDMGVRIFTLTWNNSNRFAHSAVENQDAGLTDDGRAIARKITELGGIVDLSHSSDQTFYDILNLGIVPMLSHSCVRKLKNSSRNATDDMIQKLGEVGGIIGINFFAGFLSTKSYSNVSSEDIVRHIVEIIDIAGENVSAMGSDFDGVSYLPNDIADAGSFYKIAETMEQHDIEFDTIEKVMGNNFLNYWIARSK